MDRVQYNLGLILFTICFLNLNILGFTQTSTPTPVNTSTPTPTNTATSTPFATFTPIPTPTNSTYPISAFNYSIGGFKPINSDETGLISGNLNVDGNTALGKNVVGTVPADIYSAGAAADETGIELTNSYALGAAGSRIVYNGGGIDNLCGIRFLQNSTQTRGSIIFSTNNTAGMADRMALQYDGKLGIGTTTPSERLEIYDGNFKLGSTVGVKQAQNGDTGPFMVSGLLDREVTTSPVLIFSNTHLHYSLSTTPVTALFKLNPIPVTVNNAAVVVDAVRIIYKGTDAGDYFDTVRLLEYNNSSGLTQIVNFTTNTGGDTGGSCTSFNILSSDISRATYQKSWYIEFTMVEATKLFLYDVVMQYHLE